MKQDQRTSDQEDLFSEEWRRYGSSSGTKEDDDDDERTT